MIFNKAKQQDFSGRTENEKKRKVIEVIIFHYFKWIIIFLVLVILFLGYTFLLKSKYKQVFESPELGKKDKMQEYLDIKDHLAELNNLIDSYHKISQKDIDKVNFILPNKYVPEKLFTQIDSIILKNGSILTSLTIKVKDEESLSALKSFFSASETVKKEDIILLPDGVEKITLSLNIAGVDYVALKNIIRTIENNLRLMDITNISFEPGNGSLNMEIDTYYLKE